MIRGNDVDRGSLWRPAVGVVGVTNGDNFPEDYCRGAWPTDVRRVCATGWPLDRGKARLAMSVGDVY